MSKPEAPRNHDNTTEQNIHHSGESLSNEFENTPLSDFEDVHVQNIPKDPSTLLENMPVLTTTDETITRPIVETQSTKENSNRSRKILLTIGGSAAALAVAGAAFFAVKGATDSSNAPEKNDDDTSQVDDEIVGNPPVDGETPQVGETEKTLEQLIEDNKIEAGLSAEEYAETFQNRLDSWALAGTTKENYWEWVDSADSGAFEDQIAASQAAIYTNALFVPGYHNEPSLVNVEANFTLRNAAWYSKWNRSYDFNNDKGTLEIDSVIEQAVELSANPEIGERVVYIAGYDTNNAADALFVNEEVRQGALDANGQSWDHTLTLKTIDGFEYISKFED